MTETTIESGYLPIAKTFDEENVAQLLGTASELDPKSQALFGRLLHDCGASRAALGALEELRRAYDLEPTPHDLAYASLLRTFARIALGNAWDEAEGRRDELVAETALTEAARTCFGASLDDGGVEIEDLVKALEHANADGEVAARRSTLLERVHQFQATKEK